MIIPAASCGLSKESFRICPNNVTPQCLYRGSTMLTTTLSQVEWVGGPVRIFPGFHFDKLLCRCQAHYTRDLFFLSSFMTSVLPDQRETCCYSWHDTWPSHLLGMRPSLGHKAPGSLSQASNRQEFVSPGSACRRVVPWGDVSSWVKGAE